MPLSPSAHVSLTSPNVGAITAQRVQFCVSACHTIHSAAVRVLPAPRPARYSHTDHVSSFVGNCSGLASSASHVALRDPRLSNEFNNSGCVLNELLTLINRNLRLYLHRCI